MASIKSFAELSPIFRAKVVKVESKKPPQRQFVIKEKSRPKDTSRGVFGCYKPRPVDRAAALMLATSRWNNPPEQEPSAQVKPKKKTKVKKMRRVSKPKMQSKPVEQIHKPSDDFLTAEEAWRMLK